MCIRDRPKARSQTSRPTALPASHAALSSTTLFAQEPAGNCSNFPDLSRLRGHFAGACAPMAPQQ
eukprot:6630578-Alexandrium_andersonii.AAC.1